MARNVELWLSCNRFLSGHPPKPPRAWLEELAASELADLPMDMYGDGPAMARLEQEVADLLGKEAAVFVPKGVIAQLMALRVWTERSGKRTVALHPKSHIDLDERNAYERVHQLIGLRVGKDHQPFTLQDLMDLHEPCGAIVVELPLRHAGYKLPEWDELFAISEWAHDQQIPLHFDGARLWECAPYYECAYDEIASLADSVYVSFYKGLGGMAGCVLAGTDDFIAEAQIWKERLGGSIFTTFPYVLSAYEGLQHHLPKMPELCEARGRGGGSAGRTARRDDCARIHRRPTPSKSIRQPRARRCKKGSTIWQRRSISGYSTS